MPEEIYKPFTGKQVIKVNGVCYEWVEFTPDANETSGSITEQHDQCSDCSPDVKLYEYTPCILDNSSSSSSEVVPFAAACAGCGHSGDVHWVFGNETAISAGISNASFNVDDNGGTGEIVWFTFTEGATEYAIKYTQQEFAFTVGGKSISEIVITETGQSDIIYSLTANQDGVLKDGIGFSGTDSFTIGSNVAKVTVSGRTIDSSSGCCLRPDEYFSLLNLDVHFQDGVYYTDEIGGALYAIWKKSITEPMGAINTDSYAGIDGVGDFLGGSRNDYSGAPNTLREATNKSTMASIANKMAYLSTISGSWTADWDPLAEEPYECPIGSCGTPNADPTVFVTVVWTDLDATKNYLGCSWCNGETKEVYATNYVKQSGYMTSTNDNKESWIRTVAGDKIFMKMLSGGGAHSGAAYCYGLGGGIQVRNNYSLFYDHITSNLASDNLNEYNINAFSALIQDAMFGYTTTTSGVTITWARGNDW